MPQTTYTDGGNVVHPTSALNICNSQPYAVEDYSIAKGATQTTTLGAFGEHLGSDTRAGAVSGSFTALYANADDGAPTSAATVLPGHVFSMAGMYVIAGAVTEAYKTGDACKYSVPFVQAVNPIISSLLSSAYGQGKAVTHASGSTHTSSAQTVVNKRTGATGTYSLRTGVRTGGTVPANCTINSTTGIITYTTPVIGSYSFDVVYTETLAGQPTLKGFATYYLTVT